MEDERKLRMHCRENRKWYILYPEDTFKERWDIIMTFFLIFTCSSTPLFISFHEDSDTMTNWEYVNLVVDIFFAMDIIVIFLAAFYDDDF